MSSPEQKSALNVVMGTMTFGHKGMPGIRVHDVKEVEAILDVFRSHGHTELDSSRFYGAGTSEKILGEIDWKGKGLIMETKLPAIHPTPEQAALYAKFGVESITHNYEDIKKNILLSLKALKTDCLDIWYLHTPDRTISYKITLKAVNDLYKEGYFKKFAISNYTAWEVAEIVTICKENGYIMPCAYQGIYNAVHRNAEPELFPCLRKFGLAFYEFNPLGGGFFTGQYSTLDDTVEPGSRFDPASIQGQQYRQRYWNEHYFKAMERVKAVADKHNLTMAEVALRWVNHHSLMKREYGDSVLIGASKLEHIQQNLIDLEKGPLPEEVVKVLDEAWEIVKPYSSKYHH